MKWVRTAIGAVVAVFSIGIIATTIFKMTQSSEVIREVSFDIDYDEGKYYPISVYNEILEYGVIDEDNNVINIVSVYVNDEINEYNFYVAINPEEIYFSNDIPSPDGAMAIDSYIDTDGNWYNDGGALNFDINVKLVFEIIQPPKLTGISATLILLIPIIFVSGVLLYFYKLFRKE